MSQSKLKLQNQNLLIQSARSFGCPCGKTYLSYPALFTHVKQKHDGKPPGPLKKPKKDQNVKRGRPPLHPHENSYEDQAHNFNYQDYLSQIIPQSPLIKYDFEFFWEQGTDNCNQIFSKFLNTFAKDLSKKKTLNCFIGLLVEHLNKTKGEDFCATEDAGDIIDTTNQLVSNFEIYKENYPLSKKLLINLIWVFFLWLYKQRLTDHKLEKQQSFQ